MHSRLLLTAALGLAIAASPALAGLHYFTQDSTLYTYDGSSLNSFAAEDTSGGTIDGIVGLGFDSSGTLWASSNTLDAFYTLTSLGGGTAVFTKEFNSGGNVITFDFIGGDIVGLRNDTDEVVTYDLDNNGAQTTAGITNDPGFPSSAYIGSTFYAAGNDSKLYEVNPSTGALSNAKLIEENGSTLTWDLAGGSELNGAYWQAITQNGEVRIGTLDLTNGDFTEVFDLGDGSAFNVSFGASAMGYAVIPAPGAGLLALLGTGVIAAMRRRVG